MMKNLTKNYTVQESKIKVFSTTDLSIFKRLSGNRPVNQHHVSHLKKSIKEHGWIQDELIKVSELLYVLDGQHRLEALEQLQKESGKKFNVNYIVKHISSKDGQLLSEVREVNTHRRNWTPSDYINSNIELGHEEYEYFKSLMERYRFPYVAALSLIVGHSPGYIDMLRFRRGQLSCKSWRYVEICAENLNEIKKRFKYANHKNFVLAMLRFWDIHEFNNDEFIKKLDLNPDAIYRVPSVDQYIRMIAKVYNYKRREKINFSPLFED